ncbi:MauE/DoxX family redox-associated membrane protein [Sphingobacterium sp. MYb388]|uniref:MauE/DoxX family redox-associated membrane protein n=1 Tax=Sphingobacterium sp. MYb388 TaxID=2745437 RepID=UPI0030B4BE14
MRAKTLFVDSIAILFIILWVYAAVSKLFDYNNFSIELGKAPLLSGFAPVIAVGIPFLEIALAIMLLVERTKFIALVLSSSLLLLFTVYLFIILNYSSYIPCSCGGILGRLGYKEHIFFNLILFALGIASILLYQKENQHNQTKYNNLSVH